jgi:hypothetical protein
MKQKCPIYYDGEKYGTVIVNIPKFEEFGFKVFDQQP